MRLAVVITTVLLAALFMGWVLEREREGGRFVRAASGFEVTSGPGAVHTSLRPGRRGRRVCQCGQPPGEHAPAPSPAQ